MKLKLVLTALALLAVSGCVSDSSLHDQVRFGDQDAAYVLINSHSDSWRAKLDEHFGEATLAEAGGARLACMLPNDGAAYFSLVKHDDAWVCLAWAFAADGTWGGFTVFDFTEDLGSASLAAHEQGALVVSPLVLEDKVTYAVIDHLKWDGKAFSRGF